MKKYPDIIMKFGHGLVIRLLDSECFCVCHGYDAVNRVRTGGHWWLCPSHHRETTNDNN